MSYFYLLPLYWLSGTLLYAASPRQQINNKKKPLIIKSLAYAWLAITLVISLFVIFSLSNLLVESMITLLIFAMLFIPAPVILLSHKPQWLKGSFLFVISLSVILQVLAWGV